MKKFIFVLSCCFFILIGFKVKGVYAEKVVAEVGTYKLYEKDLEDLMKSEPQVIEILKVKPELKPQIQKSLIERWVNITMLYLAAKEDNLKDNEEVKKKLFEAEKMILAEEYLKRKLSQISFTEEEMKTFYEQNKDKYKEPEAIHLKHILIYVPEKADKTTLDKALNKAKQIRAQLLKGASFEELARMHSDDAASREKGGDLGILKKGETIPEFEEKVFKLKIGEISEPIRSPYGFHIVKVVKKVPPSQLPYEKVREKIKEDIKVEKERALLEKYIEELSKRYSPKIY
ncbi:MAG: peptidylprolyl isomerase [Caldimicrobium sp.]